MPLTETVDSQPGGRDEPTISLAIRANRYDIVSRLADDVAHEIKNPLNAIVVNLEVLRRRAGSGETASALERADVIDQEIRRVHGLVEQLLQLLRPAKQERSLVAVDGILDSLAPAIEIQAKAALVGVEIEAESDLYARVKAEPLRFALLNLIGDAVDTEARTRGRVSIRARRAADEIYVLVTCATGVMAQDDERIQFCRALMHEAGGMLESVASGEGGVGSTATIAIQVAGFV
jgi:signal transduction histidine kinase